MQFSRYYANFHRFSGFFTVIFPQNPFVSLSPFKGTLHGFWQVWPSPRYIISTVEGSSENGKSETFVCYS